MTRDIDRRLTGLEVRRGTSAPKSEVWVNEGNGLLRNRAGNVMTQQAFEAAFPNARKIKLNVFDNSNRDRSSVGEPQSGTGRRCYGTQKESSIVGWSHVFGDEAIIIRCSTKGVGLDTLADVPKDRHWTYGANIGAAQEILPQRPTIIFRSVPGRDQVLGIGPYLRPKRASSLGLLGRRGRTLAFHPALVEAHGQYSAAD
jgi:hypothetical protein